MKNKFIGRNLVMTSNKLKRFLDKLYQKNDLYLSQARVLSYLYFKKEINSVYQYDIEAYFQIRKSSVTGLLASLDKQGLIKRVQSSEDKRKKEISLTKQGLKKAREAISISENVEIKLSKAIDNDELIILNNILDKINKWLIVKERSDEEFI